MLEFVHVLMQSLGWDPIFEYEGQTYAEMDKEAKVSAFFRPLCGFSTSTGTGTGMGMGMQTYPRKKKSESLTPLALSRSRTRFLTGTRRWSSSSSGWQKASSKGRGPAGMGIYRARPSHPSRHKDLDVASSPDISSTKDIFRISHSHSLRTLGMLLLPILNPLCDSGTVALDIAVLLAVQFDDDLFVVSFTGLFRQNAEDLGVQVLL
jgi:hypothetical protein